MAIDEARLRSLRALLEKKTPGEWTVEPDKYMGEDSMDALTIGAPFPEDKPHPDDGYIALFTGGPLSFGDQTKHDAALIVAAVNALPSLLDTLAAADWLREAVETVLQCEYDSMSVPKMQALLESAEKMQGAARAYDAARLKDAPGRDGESGRRGEG